MKNILLITLCLLCSISLSASVYTAVVPNYDDGFVFPREGHYEIVSRTWVTVEVIQAGKKDCKHEWVYSETTGGVSNCAVYHNGSHCSLANLKRKKICRMCGRIEQEEEQIEEKWIPPPVSEYEVLEASFTKK
jgi:hypothetical protein